MRVMVLGNAQRRGVQQEADRLLPLLRAQCDVTLIDLLQSEDLTGVEADISLVLGGDGAILRAARQMGYQQIPVLGVNLGKLGFLADFSPDELLLAFPKVVQREYRVTDHLMFECIVQDPDGSSTTYLGLNDVTVQSGAPFPLIQLDLLIDGEQAARYNADGLVISTPIGSTAHSLSAGGPILEQQISAFVITPICPHSLTMRPLVDSAEREHTITLCEPAPGTCLVIDGQKAIPLTPEHSITVRKAPVTFGLVKTQGRSYYQTLRSKLNWGAPPNYREE